MSALRLSLSLFTVAPVRAPLLERHTARGAMLAAPLVGLLVGAVAASAVLALRVLIDVDATYRLLVAVAGVAVLTAASRGLHLDGLADTADALGSYRGPAGAAEIMAKGDIGPFGIVAIVFALLFQVGGLQGNMEGHRGTEGLLVAALAGGLSATIASAGFDAARPSGLGALVARSVLWWHAAVAALACALVAALVGMIDEASGIAGSVRPVAALGIGVLLSWLFTRHAVRRFGGISGDVFGAGIEIAITSTLIAVAVIR